MALSITIIIAITLFSFLIAAFLLKKYFNAETVLYVFSLLRTKRFNGIADKLSKSKILELLAEFGVILGFGLLAVDYMYTRKMKLVKRVLFLAIAFAFLWLFFRIEPIGAIILSNPMLSNSWQIIMTASFAFFGLAGFTIIMLVNSAIDILTKIFTGVTPCPGVVPLVPGIQFPNVPQEATPPIHIWLTFFVLLFVHEFSHGILMRKAKITIKSFGLILLGYLPFGAFAEPDEKQLKKAEPKSALRVYAAGPASNFYSIPIIQGIILLFVLFIVNPFLPIAKQVEAQAFQGVIVKDVNASYSFCGTTYPNPAFGILQTGMVIKEINGKKILGPTELASTEFSQKDTNFLVDINGTLTEKHFSFSDKNQSGLRAISYDVIRNKGYVAPTSYKIIATAIDLTQSFLLWLFLLSIAVATANFIPMDPFDGGRMIKILLLPYFGFLKMKKEDTEKLIGRIFLIAMLLLLLLNALPLFLL